MATTTAATASAPPPTSVLFARGVIARLALWPALRAAVDDGWGGPEAPQKRTWLASTLVDQFEEQSTPPDVPYIEEMLLQVMEDEFDTVLEDGSAETVAKDVVRLWEDATQGRAEGVFTLEAQADKIRGKKVQIEVEDTVQVEEGEEEEGEWEDESDDEAPTLVAIQENSHRPEPEVDEDGFTLVKKRGSSHRW